MLGHTGLYQKWKTREKRLENGEYRELLLKSEEKQRMAKYLATSRLGSLINLIPKRKCGERSWSLIAVTYFKKTIKMYWILKVSHLQGQLVFSGYGFHGGQKIKVKEYKSTWKTTATDDENSIYVSCHIRESKSGHNSGRHSLLPLRQASYPAYLSAKIQQRHTT